MPQDRHLDDPLGGVFRHRLKQAAARADGCPPADLLAAYFERSLAPAESLSWETHFSACLHCQEQLAVLARIESTVGAAAPVAAPSPRFSFLNWRWLAPAFAAAGVLAIWVAVRPPMIDEVALNKQAQAVAAAPATSVPAGESAKGAVAATEGAPAKTGRLADAASAPAAKPAIDKLAAGFEKNVAANQIAAATAETQAKVVAVVPAEAGELRAPGDEKKDQAKKESTAREVAALDAAVQRADAAQGAKRVEEEKLRDPFAEQQAGEKAQSQLAMQSRAPSAVLPAAPQQRPQTEPAPRRVSGATAASSEARANESQRQAAVARTQEAPPKQEEDGVRKLGRSRDAVSPAKPEFTALAGRIEWRFFRDGRIERYDERLKSGDVVASPSGRQLLGASAPSEKVCWAVGRAGTILRTVNVAPWQVIGSPTDEDLVFIEARDEQNATVRTASGKTYSTADGGRTWRSQ